MSTAPLQFGPPPRHVPLSLRILNFFNIGAQAGWFFFGFGMIFFWIFVMNADFSFVTFRGPIDRATGYVTRVEETGASENKQPVRAHHYEYSVAGRAFAGTSYVTGRELPDGEAVTVEYDPTHPERSRIEGMRRAEFSPFVAFVVIFPLIGYIVLTFCTFLGRRRTHLLQNGEFAMGVLTAKRATNMTVNKRPVMELTFEFKGRDGRVHEAKARSSTPAALEDEAQEPLLYDPEDPSTAYVLDEVPSRPQLGMNGELTGRPLAAALSLIIPTIVILANVLVVLGRMGK